MRKAYNLTIGMPLPPEKHASTAPRSHPVKLHSETLSGVNAVQRHQAGQIVIHGVSFERSVLVPWQGEIQSWEPTTFEALLAQHFEQVAALRPELVIFGSGQRLRFPQPALLRPLIEQGVGVESMDSAAACRTYNVLVGEGRRAVLALLLGTPGR
jgi:uncharacterized protein